MAYTVADGEGNGQVKVIGLTGGIATGKSTVARALRRMRLPVFDADATVRALQAPGGPALPAIALVFPGTVRSDGPGGVARLDRATLRQAALSDPQALLRLEAMLHPMVRERERAFLAAARRAGARAAVLDIPLLVETGRLFRRHRGRGFDAVIVTLAPPALQRLRALRRGTLTEAQLAGIMHRQMSDVERIRHARRTTVTRVVNTGLSLHHGNVRLLQIMRELLR